MFDVLKKLFVKSKNENSNINEDDNLNSNIEIANNLNYSEQNNVDKTTNNENQKEHIEKENIDFKHINAINSTNPYINNKLHLDYHLATMAKENISLKKQRIVLTILLLSSIAGLVYLGGQSKKDVIVTMVDNNGKKLQPINLRTMENVDQRDAIIKKTIEDTVIKLRTVTPDKNLQYELLKQALINVKNGSQAHKIILSSTREDNLNSPYNVGKKHMITPIIKDVMKQNIVLNNDNVNRAALVITWRERWNKLDGTYAQTNEFKGTFIFDIIPPKNEDQANKNPFGIQIETIQIVPVRIVDKASDSQPLNNSTATQGASNAN